MRNLKIAESKLNRVAALIGSDPVPFSTICYYLNKEFKSLSVKFRSKGHTDYSISGHFNPYRERDEGDLRYNILITYDKRKTNKNSTFIADNQFWKEIMLVMVHEFRHGYQNQQCKHNIGIKSNSKFKNLSKFVREEINYLTDPNELDAYAFESAYAMKNNISNCHNYWTVERYRVFVGKYDPKLYNKFLKKVYLFSHK